MSDIGLERLQANSLLGRNSRSLGTMQTINLQFRSGTDINQRERKQNYRTSPKQKRT